MITLYIPQVYLVSHIPTAGVGLIFSSGVSCLTLVHLIYSRKCNYNLSIQVCKSSMFSAALYCSKISHYRFITAVLSSESVCTAQRFPCIFFLHGLQIANGLCTAVHVSNQHYTDRICKTARKLTHRHHLEAAQLGISGLETSFAVLFLMRRQTSDIQVVRCIKYPWNCFL